MKNSKSVNLVQELLFKVNSKMIERSAHSKDCATFSIVNGEIKRTPINKDKKIEYVVGNRGTWNNKICIITNILPNNLITISPIRSESVPPKYYTINKTSFNI